MIVLQKNTFVDCYEILPFVARAFCLTDQSLFLLLSLVKYEVLTIFICRNHYQLQIESVPTTKGKSQFSTGNDKHERIPLNRYEGLLMLVSMWEYAHA